MVGPAFLLDVNALLALLWPRQEHHSVVESWFLATGKKHWATCPITEAGCVRLLSNPIATPGALRVSEALHVLAINLKQPGHVFLPDDVDLLASLSMCKGSLQGYRQVTDAYLLGLAIHHKAHLVTLDGGIASLAPAGARISTRVINLLDKPSRN
jgi:toxin-antitoxin system PIN domain toxin